MIAVENGERTVNGMHRTVRERRILLFHTECRDGRLMRNAAEHDNGGQPRQVNYARREKAAAGFDLNGVRLVFRRHTAHGIGNHAIGQLQPVIGTHGKHAGGKSEFQKRCVEEVAGIVACERTTGPVGALKAWREANDQQPRII